ncbi:hypothetical protein F4814DRAFT_399700 [Daldinia grandis]|nr:hypothetical protein F4814DRAFT_399700 [Daldinia grandis]
MLTWKSFSRGIASFYTWSVLLAAVACMFQAGTQTDPHPARRKCGGRCGLLRGRYQHRYIGTAKGLVCAVARGFLGDDGCLVWSGLVW